MLLISLSAAAQPASPLLPIPAQTQFGRAALPLKGPLKLVLETTLDPRVAASARQVIKVLPNGTAKAAGLPLQIRYGRVGQAEKQDEEKYSLRITPLGVSISAPTSLGVLRALATLRQLPRRAGRGWELPEVDIDDQPRFAWRGLSLDVARHFLPVAVVKRNLDGMAAVKLNVLHWHLCDDQGWRVESRLLPRLQGVGAATGGYYTQAQVREVLAYAAARGIRVVPEFDLPGHAGAIIAAYPRLASNPDSSTAVPTRWGVLNIAIDPTRETTYTLLDSLLTEMTGLFPDPYFHIGGDENDGRQWRRNPRIVAFMLEKGFVKANGQPDKHQLQTYFNRRMLALLQRQGKTMVGWDEILGPDLPAPVVIESWRGPKGLLEAARLGHPALRAHGYYVDLYQTAAAHYAADPQQGVPDSLARRVLGGEAAMWLEFADSVIVDSRIWPRAAAVAERLWSPAALSQDVPDMYRRLALVSEQLDRLGLRHRRAPARLLKDIAGPSASAAEQAALRNLAGVVEPVKEYQRHFQGFKYSTETSLNRLVDAAPAESEVARRFAATVDSLLGPAPALSPTTNSLPPPTTRKHYLATLRAQLTTWQQTDSQLAPLLARQPLLREYAPLSASLSAIATLLLQRLKQLESSEPTQAGPGAPARLLLPAAVAKPAGQATLAPALLRAAGRLL
ncbi:beta-N-acetylhexosaminidase [uncultured Hymenobacter sp.]|uniref:beta-N-acetylhexosaminidase n=1 Tax=uncultured Hymenobacter sp. TaxID=170016 RepID=UPI0035CC2400